MDLQRCNLPIIIFAAEEGGGGPILSFIRGKKKKRNTSRFFSSHQIICFGRLLLIFCHRLAHMKQPRKADAPPPRHHPVFLLTCLDGVLEGGAAADQDVVQGAGLVLQLPVVHLQQLAGVVEVDHFGVAIERLHDVGQQDVHHLLQEAQSLGVAVHGREEVWGTKKWEGFLFFYFFLRLYHFWEVSLLFYFFLQQIPKINQGDLCSINDRFQGVFRFSHAKINN